MADNKSEKRREKGHSRYLCGVPGNECQGGRTQLAHGLGKATSHPSASDAFACHRRWLLSQGFIELGGRMFANPNGGPVRVLTKKTRFGARLRPGKAGRHMARGNSTGGTVAG